MNDQETALQLTLIGDNRKLQDEIQRLKAVNAELVEAAESVSDRLFKLVGCVAEWTDCRHDIDAINALKSVITKVKEQSK